MTSWQDRERHLEVHPWRTAVKWVLGTMAIIAIVMVAGGIFGWWFGWGSKVAEVTGAENTDAQFTALYEDLNRMQEGIVNYCAARGSEAPEGSIITEDPAFAYRARVLALIADYNRRMDNFFEAGGLVIKPDLPRHAPTISELVEAHC